MATKTEDNQLGLKTFSIAYADGSRVTVKPVSWKALNDVQILQYEILTASANSGGSPGELLNPENKDFWEPARKLAAIMPVVGHKEPGIDVDLIEDVDQLIKIFVTTSETRDPENGFIMPGEEGYLLPSLISKVNGINFLKLLAKVQQELMTQTKKKKA